MAAQLQLDPVLDLSGAQPLKIALTEHRGEDLVVDASQVQRLGGLCLQLLLAARRAWTEDGHSFAVAPRSEAFASALSLYGAVDRFDAETQEGTPA